MGVEKSKSRLSEFIARACRLPKEVAGRVNELSDSISKQLPRSIRPQNNFPYKFLMVATLLLLFLPWMTTFTYIVPPQIEMTLGNKVDTVPYCNIVPISEEGVTNAILLNNTPFSLSDDWDLNQYYIDMEYDLNRYGRNESDGYHFSSPPFEYSSISLIRMMQIPLFNYSEVTISVEVEGISGNAGIYLDITADDEGASSGTDIIPKQIHQVNVSAPLGIAKIKSNSWLGTIGCYLHIRLAEGAQIVLRSIVIEAAFTGKLNRVRFDMQSTDNASLYENQHMTYFEYRPQITIVQNNDTDSVGLYSPCRANDEMYLPPGVYEGVTDWSFRLWYYPPDIIDPSNSSIWIPDINFVVSEDTALEVDVRLFVLKLDIDISPSVVLRKVGIWFTDGYSYYFSTHIVGSTLYSRIPDYLYIPGSIESLNVTISISAEGLRGIQQFYVVSNTIFDTYNNSMNLQLEVNLPYALIGGVLIGLGESIILFVVGFLIAGFVISLRRVLRYSDLRNRLSDSRIPPLFLLSASIFLPWSMQFAPVSSSNFEGVSRISWFSMPFIIRWTDSTAIQLLKIPDWWYSTLISTFLLFIPLCYGFLSLASPEEMNFNKTFAFGLLLPYLVVLSAFNFSAISLDTISIGPIFAIIALPVWLFRLGLRKLKITM